MKSNRSKGSRRRLLVLVLVLAPFAAVLADVQHIYMRDGRVITGRVVSQSVNKVWIRTSRRIMVISKRRIRRIAYDTPLEKQHLRELKRQKRKNDRILEERLKEELAKARAQWERERRAQEQRQRRKTKIEAVAKDEQIRTGGLWRRAQHREHRTQPCVCPDGQRRKAHRGH